ncbi:MAG: DUF2235 domain-containing protein [Woeseiaceae bacterium]
MKRIVICADGTWNVRDQLDKESGKRRPTNVTKTARAILPRAGDGIDQVVFYHDGLGTRGPMDKVTGGAFGAGIEDNVRNIYRSIVYNYEPGDELYFFGFSRGAFTVRTLAGFMNLVGLVEKDDDYYVPEIYRCYEENKGRGTKEWQDAFHNVRGTRPCPPIKFIGVWDTVGALGAPGVIGKVAGAFNGNKYAYHDVSLNENIVNAYHALAIDERRKPFAPTLWSRPDGWSGVLEQAWFPGVHSNIGGGYKPDGLANEALHWIISKAKSVGLDVDSSYLEYFEPHCDSKLHDSMSMKYRLMGPGTRTIGAYSQHGECVHEATVNRLANADSGYAPKNLTAAAKNLPVVGTEQHG